MSAMDFAAVRNIILQNVIALNEGRADPQRSMALAASVKVLNDNVLAEVAVGKLHIQAAQAKVTLPAFGQLSLSGSQTPALEHQTAAIKETPVVDCAGALGALDQEDVPKENKVRLPRIGVVGLLASQAGVVSEKLARAADLVFWDEHQGRGSLKALANCDAVFLHTRHAGHSTDAALQAAGANIIRCTGGVTNMLATVRSYLQKA